MTHGNGVSRGDRNRNARLARLRELVPLPNAIVAIGLADKKQMVVLTDHDSKVCWPQDVPLPGAGTSGSRWTGPRSAPQSRASLG